MNDIVTFFTNIAYTVDPLTGSIIGATVVVLLSGVTIAYKVKKNKKIKLAKEKEQSISSETIHNIEKSLVEPIHTVSSFEYTSLNHGHKVLNQINTLQPSEHVLPKNSEQSLLYVTERMNNIALSSQQLMSQLSSSRSSLDSSTKSVEIENIPSISSLLKSPTLNSEVDTVNIENVGENNNKIVAIEDLPEIPLLSIENIIVPTTEENSENNIEFLFKEQAALPFEEPIPETHSETPDVNKVVIEDLDFFMYDIAITANEEDKKIVEQERKYQQQLTNEFGPLNDVSQLISFEQPIQNNDIKNTSIFEVKELADLGTMIRKESEGLENYSTIASITNAIHQSIWVNWMLIHHGQSTAKTSVFEIQNKWGTKQAVIELENLLNNETSLINQDYSYTWSVISVVPLED